MDYEWGQLELIFNECLKLHESDRKEYILRKAADNPQLEAILLLMLENEGEEEHYFRNLQGGIANALNPDKSSNAAFSKGDVIGKFKIETLLDKGGMGEVYLASRNDGQFKQNVAIKCFPNAAVNNKGLENFHQEQQFLATLNHANIVHIIDGGSLNGVPYIIMDYVSGKPIDQYLIEKAKTEKEKLLTFVEICETVQFAHNHLILHLDIKPNNILVTEEGKLKLLDFGISKKTDAVADKSDKLMATPLFSAPEQLNREPVSIATDIYQLGILLHLMLTGEVPFSINHDTHPVRTLKINKVLVAPELHSILKKCLSDKPQQRFSSANELIQEIKFYLNKYPVTVHSNRVLYKTGKFLQRHKLPSLLSFVLVISLIIGIISSKTQANIAREQKLKAEIAAEKSKQVSEFLFSIFESANPELRGSGKVQVDEILKESINKIKLYPNNSLKAELLSVLGTTLSKAGNYQLADSLLSQSIMLFEKFNKTPPDNYYLAFYELSKSRMYNSQLDESMAILKTGINKLYSDKNNIDKFAGILNLQYALILMEAGNLNKADSIFNLSKSTFEEFPDPLRKAEAFNVKASILNYQGNFDSSIYYLQKSLSIIEKYYTSNHSFYLIVSENLASAYRQTGALEKALLIKKATISQTEEIFGKKHLEFIKSANGLGLIYKDMGSLDLAYQYLNEAVVLTEEVLGEFTLAFVSSAGNLALVLSDLEKFQEAESFAKRANENAKQLVGDEHPFYLWSLGIYAETLAQNNKLQEAEQTFQLAIKEQSRIMGEDHAWVKKAKKGLTNLYKDKSFL